MNLNFRCSFLYVSLFSSLALSQYRPDVCFEKGEDIWKVKKPSHLSGILKYKKLTPLWCDNCSINTTVTINNLADRNRIAENSLLTLPRKCIPQQTPPLNNEPTVQDPLVKPDATENTEPVEMQLVTFNKMLVKPFLTYKNLKALDSTQMTASLFSQLSYGIELGYQRSFNDRHALVAVGSFAQYNFKDRTASITVVNNTPTLSKLGLDYKWAPNSTWAVRAGGRWSQNLFFGLGTSATEVYLHRQNNLSLSVHPEWTFYRTDDFLSAVVAGYDVVLGTTEDSITSVAGTQFELGILGSYKRNWGRIQAELSTSLRDQGADQIKTRDTTVLASLGAIYFF